MVQAIQECLYIQDVRLMPTQRNAVRHNVLPTRVWMRLVNGESGPEWSFSECP
jgi:hypothetical protein